MIKKYAFISDFDGTITDDDFFSLISKKYFDENMLAPWDKYLKGEETHFNALNAMFQQINIDEAELREFISKIEIDKNFHNVIEICFQKKIPIYICSAGCDYYIKELVGKELKKYNITLVTNHSVYNQEQGLKMSAPDKSSGYFDEKVGVSKKSIVEKLKGQGYEVIFAGDGPPDIEPAKIADVVFAKKILLQKCQKLGIKTKSFSDFQDIYNFIKGI